MLLGLTIPQFYYREEDPQHWSVFLGKTCKGSSEGPEILRLAMYALATRLGGWQLVAEAPVTEFDRVVSAALPMPCPFASLQHYLDVLYESGFLPGPMQALDHPFAEHNEYSALWSRQKKVAGHRLTHDAAFYCFHHWTPEEFLRLDTLVSQQGAEYNSQDAVAVMLFWAVTWAMTSEPA